MKTLVCVLSWVLLGAALVPANARAAEDPPQALLPDDDVPPPPVAAPEEDAAPARPQVTVPSPTEPPEPDRPRDVLQSDDDAPTAGGPLPEDGRKRPKARDRRTSKRGVVRSEPAAPASASEPPWSERAPAVLSGALVATALQGAGLLVSAVVALVVGVVVGWVLTIPGIVFGFTLGLFSGGALCLPMVCMGGAVGSALGSALLGAGTHVSTLLATTAGWLTVTMSGARRAPLLWAALGALAPGAAAVPVAALLNIGLTTGGLVLLGIAGTYLVTYLDAFYGEEGNALQMAWTFGAGGLALMAGGLVVSAVTVVLAQAAGTALGVGLASVLGRARTEEEDTFNLDVVRVPPAEEAVEDAPEAPRKAKPRRKKPVPAGPPRNRPRPRPQPGSPSPFVEEPATPPPAPSTAPRPDAAPAPAEPAVPAY